MKTLPMPPPWVCARLRHGLAIPAHPLALTGGRKLDERRQRALTRYYHAAGAGGIAVGVHTTQFAIRRPEHGLLEPVLRLASDAITECDGATGRQTVRVAGLCGRTEQALAEARLAREIGYHAGLLSLAAWPDASDDTLIAHCKAVAQEMPLFGFYLQPAAGGRVLALEFWRRFVEVPNVIAIKIAPFNRYQSMDVARAVAEAGRASDMALYTGNDDNILVDLVTEYAFGIGDRAARLRIVGGLLGHWACWTKTAVDLLEEARRVRAGASLPARWLTTAMQVTDCNAAFFDARNSFKGCIAGIHEVLRRQGLMANALCLDPGEGLSPGQAQEIDRVCRAYPHLNDDAFVAEHLEDWLG